MSLKVLLLLALAWHGVVGQDCEQGWQTFAPENTCATLVFQARSWAQARTYCQQMNADLVVITSQEKNDWLGTLVGEFGEFWIGLYNLEGDVFAWVDDTILRYDNWAPGEPNNLGPINQGEDCVEMYSSAFWNDESCFSSQNFICERSTDAIIPTLPPIVDEPPCPTGWWNYKDEQCVLALYHLRTFNQARDYCMLYGGDLVMLKTSEMNDWLTGKLGETGGGIFWIGLHDKATQDRFQWVDDTYLSGYNNWSPGEPNEGDGLNEDCVEIYPDGSWNDEQCVAPQNFLCARPAVFTTRDPSATTKSVTGGTCEPGWVQYENSCIIHIFQTLNWPNARDYCQGMRGDLVMVKSAAKNDFLTLYISGYDAIWIGTHDRVTDGVFIWVDDTELVYDNWAPGEPNNGVVGEDCGMMRSSGRWNDAGCYDTKDFLCERRLGVTGPTPTPIVYEPPCPPGWRNYQDEYCALIITDELRSFNGARDYCRRYDQSDLVMPKNQAINDWLTYTVIEDAGADDVLWIGLHDKPEEDQWEWVDDSYMTWDNWAPGEPNEGDGLTEDCVEMYPNGRWNDEQCAAPTNFICGRPAVLATPDPDATTITPKTYPPATGTECGKGWLKYQNECFLIVGERRTFYLAQQYCQDRHANLAIFENQDMNDWLAYQTADYDQVFWIGLYDRLVDNTFVWIDNTVPTFTNWRQGEPNNNDGIGEDCVEMVSGGKWNDEQCLAANGFVCSKGYDEIPKCDIQNGWESYGGKCYLWVSDTKNIDEATDYCTMMDGYVISINDPNEQAFATSIQLRHANWQYWTGLSDEGSPGIFTWQDGTDTQDYDNWGPGEPSAGFSPACGRIQSPNPDVWSTDRCSVKKRFICEKDEGTCADGWVLHGGQCYQFNALQRTWFDAGYYCSSQGGWLASVLDGAENTFIASNMGRISDQAIESMWIGYSDYLEDENWEWAHETSSDFENWPPGKPEPNPGVADCASMATEDVTGTWYQMQCTLLAGFVCKIKAGATVSPVTQPGQVGSCEPRWALYGDHCYYSPNEQKTHSEAEIACTELFPDAHLASIHSYGEQSFITERLFYINQQMWIGLSDSASEGVWTWTDGTPYEFNNWSPGEPSGGSEDCVHLDEYFYKIGTWNDMSCGQNFRYLCKMPKYNTPPVTAPPSITLPPSGRCGTGWIHDPVGYKCYKFVVSPFSVWSEAEDECRYQGGHLASITSPQESAFLHEAGLYHRINSNIWMFWIGLHDTGTEHSFEWTDGAPVAYLNWRNGEPNDVSVGEDCVEFLTETGKWNDIKCDTEIPFICEANHFITQQFTTYPNSRLDTQGTTKEDLWPDECAAVCFNAGDSCRSFNYHRETRTCVQLTTDKDQGVADLLPEFEDPWDYYQRDFNGPTYAPPTTLPPFYGCAQGETGYRGYCYTLVDSTASIDDMQDICELRSSALVSIADRNEMNFVISLMQTGNTANTIISDVWLGLSDREREATYAWADGSPVTYTNWATGEPQNKVADEDCVIHNIDMDGWLDVACSGSTAYGVCKKAKQYDNVVPPSNDGCPDGWVKYMYSCYEYNSGESNRKTWDEARIDCLNKNGRLTTITSKYEQAYLASVMGAIYSYDFDYWIGLSDTVNPGTFLWVDGTYPTLSYWAPGQPDNSLFGTCVALIGGLDEEVAGMWMEESCVRPHNYICEQPIEGATDTPYTPPPVTNPSNQGCDDGQIGYGANCYIVYEYEDGQTRKSWTNAEEECAKIGAKLVSLQSAAEEEYIASQYTPTSTDYKNYGFWSGFNDRNREGGWEWSDGSPVIYTNWFDGEPNDVNNEDCGEMFLHGRAWNDVPCHMNRNWICKKPKTTTSEPTLPTIGVCPSDSDWKYASPYCYYFSDLAGSNDRLSWSQAEEFCLSKGGHLTSIVDATENAVLVEMAPILSGNYWIGLYQEAAASAYVWTDGTPYGYVNWDPGEPNNHHGKELCVELYKYYEFSESGMWNDAPCGVNTPFICKRAEDSIDPITSAPTAPPIGGCDNDNGYFKYFNRCYRMGGYRDDDRYTWQEARDVCQGEGGNLAGIHSKEVQALLTSMLLDIEGDVWIGLTDLGTGGQYHWTDGKPLVYTNWFPMEPSSPVALPGAPARDCVEIMNEQWYAGMWNDVECDNTVGYLCEKDLDSRFPDNPPDSAFCTDSSYYKYGDSCFKLDTTLRTYSQAQQFCAGEGGNLASITDSFYEAFLEYMLFESGMSDAWIGLKSNDDGEYSWSDGWPVYFSKWGDSEPSQNEGEGCVVLNDVPSWDDTSCSDGHASICRTTTATPPPPVDVTPGTCRTGMVEFGGHCYHVPDDPFPSAEWYSAREHCRTAFGGDLASIHSKAENEFVKNLLIDTQFGLRTVWLGMTRNPSGGFQWSDNTPVDYVTWANGEPTESWRGTDEDCVEMYTNDYGTWNDADCFSGASYVCKSNKILGEDQPCDPGWELYEPENMCVVHVFITYNWANAQQHCQSQLNADLVTIKTSEKNDFLTGFIQGYDNIWIGTRDRVTDGKFVWVDGTLVIYENWAPGEPNNGVIGEDCGELRENGEWNDYGCLFVLDFLCERKQGVVSPTTIPFEPPCPVGWRKYEEEYCALPVLDDRRTFNGARDYCRRYDQSDLVMPKTQAINDWLKNIVIPDSGGDLFWIGLHDKPEEDRWEWVDDSYMTWDNWSPGEPNQNDGLSEDCVEMYPNGMWNDEQCVAPVNFICGRPAVLTTTTPGPTRYVPPYTPPTGTDCGQGWLKYRDTCFLIVAAQRTFFLAQQYCQDRNADLVILQDIEMNDWLEQVTRIYNSKYWIGMYDLVEDNTFVWVDGTTPSFQNWGPGEPNNNDGVGEDCVEMVQGGRWNDEQCLAIHSFVCSKGYNAIPKCDIKNGWESFNSKCYLWVMDKKTYADAKEYCELLEGYMISVNSQAEQQFANTLQSRYVNLQYWLGLTDEVNQGTYMWEDGTDTRYFTNWGPGEPSKQFNPGCGMVKSPNPDDWTTADCGVQKRFICEKPEGTCADGWLLHGGQCYQFNALQRTWFDAGYYCNAQGGWLASILDGSENTFIANNMEGLVEEQVESMWFGYSDWETDEQWQWEHDTRSSFDNWPPGKPDVNRDVADCAFMNTGDTLGTWYQMQCTLMAGFVCKIQAGSTVTPIEAPEKVGSCEPGWALYGDSCYTSPREVLTHEEAENECNGKFPTAHLASIHSFGEQSFITERLFYIDERMWIGLTDAAVEGQWKWTDGSSYDFKNWFPGEPNSVGNEDCVHMQRDIHSIGLWNDMECHNAYRFLCKMPKYQTAPVTAFPPYELPPSDRCGEGWLYDATGNNCYMFKVSSPWSQWLEGDDQCHAQGGRLASVGSQAEANFLAEIGLYYRITYNLWAFWIGLHDTETEHGYEWSDGSPVNYLNWNPGEPNDMSVGEDCIEMLGDNGRWNDIGCDTAKSFICKRDPLITQQFTAFPYARMDSAMSTPISNLWPETCAFECYILGPLGCRSFNYHRSTRSCYLFAEDKDSGSFNLLPALEDPYDYYQRNFSGPPYVPLTTLAPSYGCGAGETGYRSYCYTLVESMADFAGMQDICDLRSSQLVSISDRNDMNFVISLMQTGNTNSRVISEVWLGLTDMEIEATYTWTDGSPVTYTNWAAGQPQNTVSRDDCVVHNYNMAGWVDVACTGTSAYGVCKKPKQTSNVVAPSTDGCPVGWRKYMSTCYQFNTGNKKTWDDARRACIALNARLTTIKSPYEQAFLASEMGALYLYSYDGDYWIGLSDTESRGTYKWVDGTYPTLSAWAPGMPDDSIYGQCVAMVGGIDGSVAGLWVDEKCTQGHNYICRRPMDGTTDTPYTEPPITRPSDEGCASGAMGYGSNCFSVFEMDSDLEWLTWDDARAQCASGGGDLASFQSAEEEEFVVNRFIPTNPDDLLYGFWFGIHDKSMEGGWEWSDGSPVIYVNWGDGEPNNLGSGENCVEMFLSEGRGWNDIPCGNSTVAIKRNWICTTPKKFTTQAPLPPIGECPSDSEWQHAEPYCYYFSDLAGSNDRFSWTAAEDFCHSKGGHLVSIESELENRILIEMAPFVASNYWIGLRQEVIGGGYAWSDGTPYTYANWHPGEPNDYNGEELCAEMYRYQGFLQDNGRWNDAACGVKTPFICKKLEDSIGVITHAPTETPVGGCDNGYFKYFNRCYRMDGYLLEDRHSWQDSRAICQAEGGNLVGIHGKEVQSLLTSMLQDMPTDVWIGFNDIGSGGQYHWTDGKPAVYVNWYPGEPNGFINLPNAPSSDCVEMMSEKWFAGMWNDAQCATTIGFLCEKDLVPDVPDNPPASTYCDDKTYYKYGDSCFKVDTQLRSYSDAQAFCESEGGSLASITDSYYEAFVEYLLFDSGHTDAWIGMTSDDAGQYTWSDGWPVYFSKWGDSEPSQKEGEGCVLLNDVPSWDDTSCSEKHPAVCRTTNESPPDPVDEPEGYCPDGAQAYGSFCYWIPAGAVSLEWASANYQCQTRFVNGQLASIHSKGENEFIRKMVQLRLGFRTVWLGLQRTSAGGFQWTDKTPVDYVHWDNGEPTEEWRGTDEDCGEIYTNDYGTWNDADCYTGASYICKMPKTLNGTGGEPVNQGLSGGAIAGIVIAVLVMVTAVLLVIGWFMGGRKAPKMPTTSSSKITTTTSSIAKDPFPTPASGFDNVVYTPDDKEVQIQIDDTNKSEA